MAIAKRSRTELATQRFEYAPAPESTDHVKIEKRYDLFIGGRMVKAHSQKRFPTINPSNEEKLSEVVEADEVDVDRAVKAASKIAPALAAGNTVVLKPAETTPLSALLFADICMQAELPDGVVNILTGAGKTGSLVVSHPAVRKVAFTGSTEVGKLIQRSLAGTGKRLTLELGGKAANIVFEDAPLDAAVEGIVNGIYFNQGHVCCAGSRLLVQESIAQPLLEKLKQ